MSLTTYRLGDLIPRIGSESLQNLQYQLPKGGSRIQMSKRKSPQLRELIVNSISQGMSISEAVETYQVARRTIYYYLERARFQTKIPRAVRARTGPRSKLENYRKAILAAMEVNPGLSMQEICELLKLPVSPSTLCRTLAAWALEAEQDGCDKPE